MRPSSGLSHEDLNFKPGSSTTPEATTPVDDVFEGSLRNSYPKFKPSYSGPRGVVSANSPYARTMPVHNSSKSHVPSALASIGPGQDFDPGRPESKSPKLPGENLPEHHFKKRYFAENLGNPASGPSSGGPTPPISSSPLNQN